MGKLRKVYKGHSDEITSLAVSADGKYLVTGSWDKTARLWNIKTGAAIQTFQGHSDIVSSVAITSDNNYVITGSHDGTIKLWDMNTGKEVASLISVGEKDYIVATPDGYCTSSRGGTKDVAWRIGTKIYPFEQFDLKYNRPDIVLERLEITDKNLIETYKSAYLKRLKKMGFKEKDLSAELHIPEAKINTENVVIATKDRIFNLSVTAKDGKYKLDRLNMYVNDVAVFGTKGISLKEENTNLITKTIPMELSYGDNKIQVSALNEKSAESYQETLYVKYTGEYKKPDLYLVAIGVSKYKNPDYNLRYAAKDADDVVQLLKELNKKNQIVYLGMDVGLKNGKLKVRSFKDKRGIQIKLKETETVNLFQEGLFNDLRRGTGAIIISSSSGDEYSYEGETWKNGVFTYSIIEGLKMKKSDTNNDKKINISELRDYVIERVKELTAGGQNPTVRRDNIDNDFVVYE